MLRRTTSAPSRRCGAIWSTVRSKIVIDGPRNSSTGVPTTTIELVGPADHRGVGAELEPAGRQELAQQLVGAGLEERHLAAGDPVERRLVRVVDPDPQARLGEGKAQREADVPAAAEDDDVELAGQSSGRL